MSANAPRHKLVLIGGKEVGKTSLASQFCFQRFDEDVSSRLHLSDNRLTTDLLVV